jgi:outer membrane lipoprotein carrier protein
MNKLFSLLIAGVLFSSNINAQVDQKAKAILDGVSTKVKTIKSMKANFVLALSKTKQTKSGVMFMKGLKYFVSLPGQEIYCDNKTITTYLKSSNEVTINDIDPAENTLTPTKLFTNFYDKEFKSKYIGEKKIGANTILEIELIPIKQKNFTKILLQINKATNFISYGKIFEKNGNIMSYTISNITSNPVIAEAQFVFDAKKHPNCEVVDLR